MDEAPVIGTSGSAAMNWVLLVYLAASISDLPDTRYPLRQRDHPDDVPMVWLTQPVIDNSDAATRSPDCPVPRAVGPRYLIDAAVPLGWENVKTGDGGPRFVCVRHAADGSVELDRFTGRAGTTALDTTLIDLVRARWQFATGSPGARRGGWQRVRVSETSDPEQRDPRRAGR